MPLVAPGELVRLYGTPESVPAPRAISCGDLTFQLSSEAIRCISWKGVELVRAISWPIRDVNWATFQPEIVDEQLEQGEAEASYKLLFDVDGGGLNCELEVLATKEQLCAALKMTAARDFSTNRAGFTVLHPIANVAGSPVSVIHSDGSQQDTRFPRMISPDQPVMDIVGLRHSLEGRWVDITFEGEVFEMEDQRNWSDASFKTYCRPLVHPFTYQIDRGATEKQIITVNFSGEAEEGGSDQSTGKLDLRMCGEAMPHIGLALEEDWAVPAATETVVSGCKASHIVARVGSGSSIDYLRRLGTLCASQNTELDLEIVVPDDVEPAQFLADISDRLNKLGSSPARVLALREAYLASYQPSGPWPEGPAPSQVVEAARTAFPAAMIGGGVLTNFTELNRCRPDAAGCDFISHGSTAIVHASDDQSVVETLEAFPQIFESAGELSGGKPYRLGLVSIGMRSNPYGADVVANPDQIRRTMVRDDPRQRGLFAAAWAVGVLATTMGQNVEALCLAAPHGPFGLEYQPQAYSQPGFDESGNGSVFPLFHVVRSAAEMAKAGRLNIGGLPDGVFGYGAQTDDRCELLVANLNLNAEKVQLGQSCTQKILNLTTFDEAVRDVDWLNNGQWASADKIELPAFAVAFVRTGSGSS